MNVTVADLATLLNGRVIGDETVVISGFAGLSEAKAVRRYFVSR